jgi:hypothetical protein
MPSSELTEYFEDDTEAPEHPMVRSWGPLIANASQASCEVDRRRDGLTYRRAKIYLHLTKDGHVTSQHDDWDFDLNHFLITKHVKAINTGNERLRFMLTLKELLRKIENRLGDGYFNAIFIDVLKNNGFAERSLIADMLSRVSEYSPHKGRSYASSCEAIKDQLKKCGRWVRKDLNYSPEESETILTGVIADYLDDRFSISNRLLLSPR